MPVKCRTIMAAMERLAPRDLAADWDNVGLLVGSPEQEVSSLLVALDVTPQVADMAAAAGADPLKEQSQYQQAFGLLKEGRYDQATKAFGTFLKTYPSGPYSDNAQYWLGESYYVNRQFQPAMTEFNKLVQTYPDSAKVSHAKLKMGLIYAETGETERARKALEEVATRYPATPQGRLARERLEKMKAEGK